MTCYWLPTVDIEVSALCLLDLTAAFHTVDHDLLLLRLERQHGLRGDVLRWFQSYTCPRANRVQACCYGSLVAEEKSSDVLERPLHSGHRRQQQPTPKISQPASTDCIALSANYIRPSGILCCGPDGLKLNTD